MPKQKSNSGAKKRFKKTGTGKIKRVKAFANHILTKKRPGRKKRLKEPAILDKANSKSLKKLLPYGPK
jgi:large subunit ribosomal protein L35